MLEATGIVTNEKGTFTYSANEAAGIRQVQADYDMDGKVDSTSLFYEDEKGQTVKGLYDNDGDGKFDDVSLFEYDNKGNLQTRYDGSVSYEYSLDENGEYRDTNNDGQINDDDKVKRENFEKAVNFTTDANGNEVQSSSEELQNWLKNSIGTKSKRIEHNSLVKSAIDFSKKIRQLAQGKSIDSPQFDLMS